MSDCDPAALSRWLDNDLSLPQRRDLEKHVSACDSCRGELAQLQSLDDALTSLAQVRLPAPPGSAAGIIDASRRRRVSLSLGGLFSPAAVGTLCAALVVAAAANVSLLGRSSPGTPLAQTAQPASSTRQFHASAPERDRFLSAILVVQVAPQTRVARFRTALLDVQ